MLISHRKRFIYLKTAKTAGTSVEIALQKYCLAEGAAQPEISTDAVEGPAGIIGARGARSRTHGQRWWNHMPAEAVRNSIPPTMWEDYTKICNIRNPWDRMVSAFHFLNPDARTLPRMEIEAEFRAWIGTAAGSMKDSHIYMHDGVPVVDMTIRYETLQDDFDQLCMALDLQREVLPRLKTRHRGAERIPYREYYDEPERRIVAELYATEIRVFGWRF